VPACPERSIANAVSYEDAGSLVESLDALGERFERAGVRAWTVWVPDFDAGAIAELERRGHRFDGKPAAMALELGDWEAPGLGDLDWDDRGRGEALGRLNDAAYGFPAADGFGVSLEHPPDFVRIYQARVAGEPVCALGTIDHEDDLGFYFVATDPAHRGHGLASRLMAAALLDARERGLTGSSLQASPMGEPIYRRLGFETHFRIHLYEKRA
jgi:GNAT superfamily N-acetyltransferase